MPQITLADAERAEAACHLRIKFAAIAPRGDPVGDAHDEYDHFLDALPTGWEASRLGLIETRTEAQRMAWHLTNGEIDLVAVEHETGLELLLIPVAINVASAAVLGFTKWGWRRWRELRQDPPHPKVEPSLVIEVPRPDGGLPPIRLIVPPPVSDDDIARYLRVALASGRSD
jgi:hypothetical protein